MRVTNVSRCRDSFFMSETLEWGLIYRTEDQLKALMPSGEGLEHRLHVDSTGTNVVASISYRAAVAV